MARVGGRSLWLAWPAGLLCAAVVGALVWLAAPAVPAAVAFAGAALRAGSAVPTAPAPERTADPLDDCSGIYPGDVWRELTWAPDMLLTQSLAGPPTDTALVDALAPDVRLTCAWHGDAGRAATTTVAAVSDDAASVLGATLPALGFACSGDAAVVRCERSDGAVSEVHEIRGRVWVVDRLSGWDPGEYAVSPAVFG